MMAPESKEWKKLQEVEGKGGYAYIGKRELEDLAEEGVIDLDDPIEYSVSVGVSDGRARVFMSLRNPPEGEEDDA